MQSIEILLRSGESVSVKRALDVLDRGQVWLGCDDEEGDSSLIALTPDEADQLAAALNKIASGIREEVNV